MAAGVFAAGAAALSVAGVRAVPVALGVVVAASGVMLAAGVADASLGAAGISVEALADAVASFLLGHAAKANVATRQIGSMYFFISHPSRVSNSLS